MKATVPGYFSSEPAHLGSIYPQYGPNRSHHTGSLFNGRIAISLHPHSTRTDYLSDDARILENAFWQKRPLQGRKITSSHVLSAYLNDSTSIRAGRFLQKLCLQNWPLNGVTITPERVIEEFNRAPARENKCQLAIARFKAECCLRGLLLNGSEVKPDAVVNDFPKNSEGKLGIAHFKEQCCLRGLLLNGQQVTPEAVINDFPRSSEGKLGIARFKQECCLRGMLLNGQQVTPDAVINDFKQGGWLLETAIFYSHLALNAKKLNDNYLNNNQVLAAFQKAPGDHSSKQVDYLIQRLQTCPGHDKTDDTLETFKQAWQIVNNAPDGENRHQQQCILRVMAMEYDLPVDHQKLSAEQVLQTINNLRSSLKKIRLHFFFLAHCYRNNLSLNGQQVQKHQVLDCLHGLPERNKLRHALGGWFEKLSAEANLLDKLVFRRKNQVVIQGEGDSQQGCEATVSQPGRKDHLPGVITVAESSGQRAGKVEMFIPNIDAKDFLFWQFAGYSHKTLQPGTSASDAPLVVATDAQILKQLLNAGEPMASDRQVLLLRSQANKSLAIIQEVNNMYPTPVILVSGSFARYLQGVDSSFNDIDIICTTEEAASALIARLSTLNINMNSEVRKKVVAWPIPGCPQIQLPLAYNISLVEGDLGTKTMGLQVSIDTRVTLGNKDVAPVHLPGVERPVSCLSFAAETRLICDTLEYLAVQLDPLTDQLQKGAEFDIPQTILFNCPKSPEERIYGLLIRCLLTLNKAKQFHSMLAEVKTGCRPEQHSATLNSTTDSTTDSMSESRLQQLTDHLHAKLNNHTCRDHFVSWLEDWISKSPQNNDYQRKRGQFIKSLLEMVTVEND